MSCSLVASRAVDLQTHMFFSVFEKHQKHWLECVCGCVWRVIAVCHIKHVSFLRHLYFASDISVKVSNFVKMKQFYFKLAVKKESFKVKLVIPLNILWISMCNSLCIQCIFIYRIAFMCLFQADLLVSCQFFSVRVFSLWPPTSWGGRSQNNDYKRGTSCVVCTLNYTFYYIQNTVEPLQHVS